MMPKQALMDPDVRADVLPGLTLHEITCILSRFHEDDFAKEPLPPGEQLSTWLKPYIFSLKSQALKNSADSNPLQPDCLR